MPAALVVPASSRTNRPLAITGTGFQVSSPVTIAIAKADLSVVVTTDISGDFDASAVFTWSPSEVGRYTISADDGTDVETADVQIYSTT